MNLNSNVNSNNNNNNNNNNKLPLDVNQQGSLSKESCISLPIKAYRYTRYYCEKSTRPQTISPPSSKWRFGSNSLKKYIMNVYLPFLTSQTNALNPVVYLKQDDVGLAGQMLGFCDTLLLCLLNQRVFKCLFCALHQQ